MKLNRRVLATVAATGVASGALAFGGVALASTNSHQSPVSSTATAATSAATATQAPSSRWCDGLLGGAGLGYGMGIGQQVMTATASYLGLTQSQLLTQLQSGKSLADVATAQGKSVSGLKDAILTAATSQINASTRLSATQKADAISELKSHLAAMVNGTYPDGFGRHGMGMHGLGGPGMGGRGPGWMMNDTQGA